MPSNDPSDLTLVLAAFLASAWHREDTQCTDEVDWFETLTPSSAQGGHNTVRRCILQPSTCDQRIVQTIERHRAHGTAIRWTVTPLCQPDDLGKRLKLHGFRPHFVCCGMLRDTTPLQDVPANVMVRRMSVSDAGAYAALSGKAWDLTPEFVRQIERDTRIQIERGRMHYFLAAIDGVDVGSCATLIAPGSGYLMGGAVVPNARKQGVYRAMVDHRLTLLRQQSINYATVLAVAETSQPICAGLGFREVALFRDFLWEPQV